MTHLAAKAKTLAEATANLQAKAEQKMDERLQTVSDVAANIDSAMANIDAVHSDAQATADALNEVAKNLTNQ